MHTGPPRRGADAAAALLAQPGAPCPAPLAGAHPLCETRIREIPRCSAISGSCGLGVRRRDETPGPGAYGLPAPLGRASHHRPMTPSDGPRPLVHGEESLRQREMQRQLVGSRPSTGGGGGQQLQPPPQFRPRRPFSATMGTAARQPCAPKWGLSISRSLQLRGAALAAAASADPVPPSGAAGEPERGEPPAGCGTATACAEPVAQSGCRGHHSGAGAGTRLAAGPTKPRRHGPAPDARLPLPPQLLREVQHFTALRERLAGSAAGPEAGERGARAAGGGGAAHRAPGPGAREAAVAAELAEQRRHWEAATGAQLRALRYGDGCG